MDLDGETIQSNQYYPFGLEFAEGTGQGLQPYKYNGKDPDSDHGLNLYDSQARFYDAAIGRTPTIDPLSEKYYNLSPYSWVANNPMKFIDPDGRDYWSTNDPEKIKAFLNSLQAIGRQDALHSFNFSSWQHTPDSEFEKIGTAGELVYDDKSNTISAFISFSEPDDDATDGFSVGIKRITLPVFVSDEETNTAIYLSPLILPQGGQLNNVYPEVGIITGATRAGQNILNSIWRAITYTPEHTSGVKTNGFTRKNKKSKEYGKESEHTKGARPSTKTKHEKGQSRKGKDKGGEKGDARRKRYK